MPDDNITAVIPLGADHDDAPQCRGVTIIPAHDCQYPPSIKASDLLEVDFGPHEPRDGMYLVEHVTACGVEWRGVRRFQRTPDGLSVDETGQGQWKPIRSVQEYGLRIAGRVCRVYRPTEQQ